MILRLTEGDQSGGFRGRAVGRRVPSGKQAEGKESLLLVPHKDNHSKERVTSDIPDILLLDSMSSAVLLSGDVYMALQNSSPCFHSYPSL